MILKSHAKLNVSLEVLEKRPDSYHNLKTVFERIDLCDILTLKAVPKAEIRVITDCKDIPRGRENLAYRAAALLQNDYHVRKGVNIKIAKRIPVGAGLGGGSSNAAAVLMGLNKLWKLRLSTKELAACAEKIGSDVPFFVYNTPFAFGEGRGEVIRPLSSLNKVRFWHILVVPRVKVSTPYIYGQWDACHGIAEKRELRGLTRGCFDVKILISKLKKKDLAQISGNLHNSLEEVTSALFPVVRLVKERLLVSGIKPVLMSGSGPAVFGIVSSRKEAVSIFRQINKENRSWKIFMVRTA